MARGQRIEPVDRHVVFARRRAQREQPLLDAFELARIVVGGGERRLEMGARLVERVQRGVECLTAGSISAGACAVRRSSRRTAAASVGTGDCAPATASCASRRSPATFSTCIMAVRRSASAVSSAGSGTEPSQLLDRVAQPVGLALRALDVGAVRGQLLLARAAILPQPRHRRRLAIEVAKGIEQPAMGRGVDQRAVVVLAVDLDQRRAERPQRLHAHRLVVDEGAGAAVGELHAPQDQLVVGLDAVVGDQRAHRMVARQLERRRHLPLLRAMAHQRGVAARAERQREGIQQDRLAGAGLAGEHGKALGEIDVEPIDQDDVADREPGKHGVAGSTDPGRGRASASCRFAIIKDDNEPGQSAHRSGHCECLERKPGR